MPRKLTDKQRTFIARQAMFVRPEYKDKKGNEIVEIFPFSGGFIEKAFEDMHNNKELKTDPNKVISETLINMYKTGLEQLANAYFLYSKNHEVSVEKMNNILGHYEGAMKGIYSELFYPIVKEYKEAGKKFDFDSFSYGSTVLDDDYLNYNDPGIAKSAKVFLDKLKTLKENNYFKESVENKNIKKTDLMKKINKNEMSKEELCSSYKILKAKHEKQNAFVKFFSFREKAAMRKAEEKIEALRNKSDEKGNSFEEFVDNETKNYFKDKAQEEIDSYVKDSANYAYLREQGKQSNWNKSAFTDKVIDQYDLTNKKVPMTFGKEFEEVSYDDIVEQMKNEGLNKEKKQEEFVIESNK